MLDKAISKGHIKGVLGHLIPEGISHIQYADDTAIMIDGSIQSIRNLKLILYCFEWLSGLKINFHKSEVYVFGYSQQDKDNMANMLNCVLGEFPMKYLGIPISDHHLSMGAFSPTLQKMIKILDPWKGRHITSGGRHILTNSCLRSITAWGSTSWLMRFTSKWIALGPTFFGKGPKEISSTTWLNGR
jgi:hypothetical protein